MLRSLRAPRETYATYAFTSMNPHGREAFCGCPMAWNVLRLVRVPHIPRFTREID
jgi:hypothetical protein